MAKKKSPGRKGAGKTAPKRAAKKAVKRAVKRAPARAAKKTSKKASKKTASRTRVTASGTRNVAVVVGDADRPQIERVASRLRARGMKVDSILDATGTITGTYSKEPSSLSKVKGVTAAEEIPTIQLPPPGSDTPQ